MVAVATAARKPRNPDTPAPLARAVLSVKLPATVKVNREQHAGMSTTTPPMAAYDVPYMERTREYYRAQGYQRDYQWAHFTDTPFAPLDRPLAECRVGVVTTAMPDTPEGRRERRVYSLPSLPPPASMCTDNLAWHRTVTHTDDVASFLPLASLHFLAEEEGLFAGLTARFHCLPTEYSQRKTRAEDAPEILRRLHEDAADIALLVPL